MRLLKSGASDDAVKSARQRFENRKDCAIEYLFYANILQSAGEFSQAREIYQQFLERFPDHPQVGMVKASIAFLTDELELVSDEWQQKLSPADFYLVDTVRMGPMKWAKKMPLKVFIELAHDTALDTKSLATKACADWQRASAGRVTFEFVPAADQSDIEIRFTSNPRQPEVADRQGTTSYRQNNDIIQHVRILVLAHDHITNKDITAPLCQQAITHELGHALGLRHSKMAHDVMYPSDLASTASNPVSKNDIEMLNVLYSSKPQDLAARAVAALDKAGVKHDAAYINLHERLARLVEKDNDLPRAAKLYEQDYAARLASPDQDVRSKALAKLRSAARSYYVAKDYANSQRCYTMLCEKLEAENDEKSLSEVMGYLAYCYLKQGKYSELDELLTKQLAVLKKLGENGERTATCYQRFGESYEHQQKYNEAIDSFAKAVELFDTAGIKNSNAEYCRGRLSSLSEYAAQFGKSRPKPQSDEDGYHSFATFDQWYLRNHDWIINHPDDAKVQSWMPKLDEHYGTRDFQKIDEMLKTRGIAVPEERTARSGIWTRP